MNAFIRFLYSVLIAGAVTLFVGTGIFSFYQPPKGPEYPRYESMSADYNSPEGQAQQKKFDQQAKDFDKAQKDFEPNSKAYQRKVSIISLVLAALSLAGGLWLFKRSDVIGEGLALGAATTAAYSVITASIADDRILRFLSVTFLLVSVLLLCKRKFAEPVKSKK